jgi:prepilin-type N-terminal cleavage/methylation domain-containing protein
MFTKQNKRQKNIRGFTIIELVVSVGIFSLVFVAAAGAFLSVLGAYQKVTTMRVNIDNLTTTLESLVRSAKTGYDYHCDVVSGGFNSPRNCDVGGGTYFAFKNEDMPRSFGVPTDPIVYKFVPCPDPVNPYCGRIQKSDNGGGLFYPVTVAPPALDISYVRFYVVGADPFIPSDLNPDVLQPQVTLIIKGKVGVKEGISVPISIQTTITQRKLDIKN